MSIWILTNNLEGINLLVEKGTHVLRSVKNVIFSMLVFCITNFLILLRHSKHEAHHKPRSTEMLSIYLKRTYVIRDIGIKIRNYPKRNRRSLHATSCIIYIIVRHEANVSHFLIFIIVCTIIF